MFIRKHRECYDVTLSGMGKLSPDVRTALLSHIVSSSDSISELLRPLLWFPELPGAAEWRVALGPSDPGEDASSLARAVAKTLWHQSEEATDCRWVKLLCQIAGGRMIFSSGMEETLRGIVEYPNYGDLTAVRPLIRASEIGTPPEAEPDCSWADHFWEICFKRTNCAPQLLVEPEEDRPLIEKSRRHLLDEVVRVWSALVDHWVETSTTSAIDARHEASFGFAFYSFKIFSELVQSDSGHLVTGRLVLRALVEGLITFAYLLKKEDPASWAAYRAHGAGQAKLIHLKLTELGNKPTAVDTDAIEAIANEDTWLEFRSINLGHWDDTNLRAMSDEAGLKDTYDKFYAWSSGYMHSNWAAVREVSYQKCVNPLHRLHRIPRLAIPKLPDVIEDARAILNSIVDLLQRAYPDPAFADRIAPFQSPEASGT